MDRRDDPVKHRTATINRLLWRVHELDPGWAPPPRSLDIAKQQNLLADRLAGVEGIVAELARDELVDVIELTGRINQMERGSSQSGV